MTTMITTRYPSAEKLDPFHENDRSPSGTLGSVSKNGGLH